jgi:hypothetical protein
MSALPNNPCVSSNCLLVCACRPRASISDPAARKDGLPKRRRGGPKLVKHPQTKHHIEEGDDEDWDGTQVGPEHQATKIPAYNPRPAQPTASEARFLQAKPLYTPVEPDVVAASEGSLTHRTRKRLAGVTVPMPPIGVAVSSEDFRYGADASCAPCGLC